MLVTNLSHQSLNLFTNLYVAPTVVLVTCKGAIGFAEQLLELPLI